MSTARQLSLDLVLQPSTNDYARLPASEKQIRLAQRIAREQNVRVPDGILEDRLKLSDWIDRHMRHRRAADFSQYPTSRQVAFAERIARFKRTAVPPECFQDKRLMSRWIESNR